MTDNWLTDWFVAVFFVIGLGVWAYAAVELLDAWVTLFKARRGQPPP